MAQYRVRKEFMVKIGESLHPEGTILELTPEEYKKVAHQVEQWPIPELETHPELKEKKEQTK